MEFEIGGVIHTEGLTTHGARSASIGLSCVDWQILQGQIPTPPLFMFAARLTQIIMDSWRDLSDLPSIYYTKFWIKNQGDLSLSRGCLKKALRCLIINWVSNRNISKRCASGQQTSI